MILSTLVTSQLHFEMCAGLYGNPVYMSVQTVLRQSNLKKPEIISISLTLACSILKSLSRFNLICIYVMMKMDGVRFQYFRSY